MTFKSRKPASRRGASTTAQSASRTVDPSPADSYAPPRLLLYGKLRDFTLTTGTRGKNDMNGSRKTGF